METLITTCEKCNSTDIEFVGILCEIEVWKCKCGHVERYPVIEMVIFDN